MDPQHVIGWAALLGLGVGSGLAWVVYQLPLRLAYDWKNQLRVLRQGPPLVSPRPSLWPFTRREKRLRSFSWGRLVLGLAFRAPYIVMTTTLLFAACAWRWGPSLAALWAMGLSAALVTLAWIDARTGLLPDVLTLPLLWLGLLLSCLPIHDGWMHRVLVHNITANSWLINNGPIHSLSLFTSPQSAILGAALGYLFLWGLYQVFWWVTRREGMGYGDFKMLAAIGAWLGIEAVPLVLLLACLVSMLGSVWRVWCQRVRRDQPQPFGPYLAVGGIIVLLGR